MTTSVEWRSFGATVIGPSHVATGKPNQDAWSAFQHPDVVGIVVSDGVGSKPHSEWGSKAVCRAVEQVARGFGRDSSGALGLGERSRSHFLGAIKDAWLRAIEPLDARGSAATCLFAFTSADGLLHLGMLGDGAVAAVLEDGTVVSLTNDKSTGFSNLTSALSATTSAETWKVTSLPMSDCSAVVLCTDGVSDDLEDVDGFVSGFSKAFGSLSSATASRRAFDMLASWPVPKHSDDKTIACLVKEVVTID